MSKEPPKQIEPAIDPNAPVSDNRFSYYILEEPNSPSVTPPNAIRVVQYQRRQFLHDDPDDFRRPYGFAEYERELTFNELDEYNLLPFEKDQILLFDLWQDFGKDKVKLLAFLASFFKMTEGDPKRRRIGMVTKLAMDKWTLKKAQAEVKKIQ